MPTLNIPRSNQIVDVKIKDGPLAVFMGPAIEGQEKLNAGGFGYLITHTDLSPGSGK